MNYARSVTRIFATAVAVCALVATPASATHSWKNYHWARTANPFALGLGDNVDPSWDGFLKDSELDWGKGWPNPLTTSPVTPVIVQGGTRPKNCKATSGRVEVCNAAYGRNGWLGLAQIWTSGDHIVQGVSKLNDTYFNMTAYNSPEWRRSVMCQEIGHTFGLGHNDEDFNTVMNTCMDYANDPTNNQHPNHHDFEQLNLIYGHGDSTTTVGSLSSSSGRGAGGEAGNTPADWGRAVAFTRDGRGRIFERDLGNGLRLTTFVTWVRRGRE